MKATEPGDIVRKAPLISGIFASTLGQMFEPSTRIEIFRWLISC